MSSYIVLPLLIVFAFYILRRVVRAFVAPGTAASGGMQSPVEFIEVNPAYNRANSSPLAALQRFQSGISYDEVVTPNQNNPSGGR